MLREEKQRTKRASSSLKYRASPFQTASARAPASAVLEPQRARGPLSYQDPRSSCLSVRSQDAPIPNAPAPSLCCLKKRRSCGRRNRQRKNGSTAFCLARYDARSVMRKCFAEGLDWFTDFRSQVPAEKLRIELQPYSCPCTLCLTYRRCPLMHVQSMTPSLNIIALNGNSKTFCRWDGSSNKYAASCKRHVACGLVTLALNAANRHPRPANTRFLLMSVPLSVAQEKSMSCTSQESFCTL